jgi:hypothetical protein
MPARSWGAAALLTLLTFGSAQAQETLDKIEREGLERSAEGRRSQETINSVNDRSRMTLEDYRAELKLVEGLETYIEMLDHQLQGQQREMTTLSSSITDVAVIERQILPLMVRMLDALNNFIELDVPFLLEERTRRVAKLRGLLKRSDVTVAEKSRRIFEAYQIENEYGRTIEAYKGKLDLAGASFDADFLRVGRVGLMYRTVGTGQLGYWDSQSSSWAELNNTPYRRLIEKGLKVARQEIAPEMVSIPLDIAQVESL